MIAPGADPGSFNGGWLMPIVYLSATKLCVNLVEVVLRLSYNMAI